MRRDRTVILGAGLCGLSAAYHLEEKAETDHLVLEQAHEAGGLARTETYDGLHHSLSRREKNRRARAKAPAPLFDRACLRAWGRRFRLPLHPVKKVRRPRTLSPR